MLNVFGNNEWKNTRKKSTWIVDITMYVSVQSKKLARIGPSDSAHGKIRKFLQHLINLKLIAASTGEKVADHFFAFRNNHVKGNYNKFMSFESNTQPLDLFHFSELNTNTYY